MAATPPEYKFANIAELADTFGARKTTFWDLFTQEHFVDMIQLGWRPNKKLLPPSVVKYINKVIIERNDRLKVFGDLKSLK